MPLIRGGEVIAETWRILSDEEGLPMEGDVILSYQRFLRERPRLGERQGLLGINLPNDVNVEELQTLLCYLDLIVLRFPIFTDGRAYSQAWRLRYELGFPRTLRASGEVLADQALFMQRVGIDECELGEDQSLETWRQSIASQSYAYQSGHREKTSSIRHLISD